MKSFSRRTPSAMVWRSSSLNSGVMMSGFSSDERIEKLAEDIDVIGLVAQGVAEHLADAGELVLTVEAEDHAEEAVELGPFHDLAEKEDILGERLLVFEDGEIDVTAEDRGN